MRIEELQSQIARNKAVINELHLAFSCRQTDLRDLIFQHDGFEDDDKRFLAKKRKDIAKYVILQKALKRDMVEQIRTERVLRSMDKYNSMRHKEFGEL